MAMRKSQAQLDAEEAYRKQQRRIAEFVRRAEKRGYRFEPDVVPKPITALIRKGAKSVSIKRLHRLTAELEAVTPESLYEKSQAISEVTGKVVSGTERRKEERSETSRKAAETRRRQKVKSAPEPPQGPGPESPGGVDAPGPDDGDEEWQKKQREKDKEQREKLRKSKEWRRKFSKANIVYNSIEGMIDSAGRQYHRGAERLQAVLDEQIKRYGFDNVMKSIALMGEENNGELLQDAQIAIRYNPGDNRHDAAIRALQELILGSLPDEQEAKELDELLEYDAYTEDTQ